MKASRQHGVSMIEAMIALGVMAAGILGALQATLIVSGANSGASKMSRATAIASQVRAGLEIRTREGLIAEGFFKNCDSSLADYASDLGNLSAPFATDCMVDLDAYDANNTPIVPTYSPQDAEIFRRVVVRIADERNPVVDTLAVVITWRDSGRTISHRQFVSFYDRAVLSASTEL